MQDEVIKKDENTGREEHQCTPNKAMGKGGKAKEKVGTKETNTFAEGKKTSLRPLQERPFLFDFPPLFFKQERPCKR